MKMGISIKWGRQVSLVSVYLCNEACPSKWRVSKLVVFVGFDIFSHHSLCCYQWYYFITSSSFKPVSLLLILFTLLWRSLSPLCYLSTHPWKGSSQIQPSPITGHKYWLPVLPSSVVIILPSFYRWSWGRSVPLYSRPPWGTCLFIATYLCFLPLGSDMYIVGSFKKKCLLMSVRALHFCDGSEGFHWLWCSCKARDPAPSNDRHPAYQSKISLVFIYSSLSCISSRSRVCFDKQAD